MLLDTTGRSSNLHSVELKRMPEANHDKPPNPLGQQSAARFEVLGKLTESETAFAKWGPDPKSRFDALEVLRAAAWRNFNDRRDYEWKFSFGIWTALALACGALLTRLPMEGSASIDGDTAVIGTT